MQLTTSTKPANELPDEREMIVEQSSAAAPVINTAAVADVDTISNSNTESTVQVKDIHRTDEEQEKTQAGSDYTGTSYATSLLSDSEEEDSGSSIIKLGNTYTQVRSAGEASMTVEVTKISCNENTLVTERKKGYRVGSMNKNINNEILNCFKGVRIEKNGNLVNQYLSCSFDPSTNICITCSSEHSVRGGGIAPRASSSRTKTLWPLCRILWEKAA
jgi:hypothetical protein